MHKHMVIMCKGIRTYTKHALQAKL